MARTLHVAAAWALGHCEFMLRPAGLIATIYSDLLGIKPMVAPGKISRRPVV
jgi:hypothetical protein